MSAKTDRQAKGIVRAFHRAGPSEVEMFENPETGEPEQILVQRCLRCDAVLGAVGGEQTATFRVGSRVTGRCSGKIGS